MLLVGLLGFGLTMLIFSFVESLSAVYAERFLSGMFAAAVTPVAAATIGSFTTAEQGRARRLAFVSMAGIAGFLLGPMLGMFVTRMAADVFISATPAGSAAVPLATTALLAFLVASAVAFTVPGGERHERSPKTMGASLNKSAWLMPKLLILTFIVSAGVGAFEVGLALRGKQELGLTPYQIALMFAECSLVMFVMQAIVFSPWFKPEATRWLIAPALAVLAAGLFFVLRASDFTLTLVVIAAVAASAGILSPILTYWISAKAGSQPRNGNGDTKVNYKSKNRAAPSTCLRLPAPDSNLTCLRMRHQRRLDLWLPYVLPALRALITPASRKSQIPSNRIYRYQVTLTHR